MDVVIHNFVLCFLDVGRMRLSPVPGFIVSYYWDTDWWLLRRGYDCFSLLRRAAFDSLPMFIRSATLALGVTMSAGACFGEVCATCSTACVCVFVLSGLYVVGHSIV
jgi:hypothetical protein